MLGDSEYFRCVVSRMWWFAKCAHGMNMRHRGGICLYNPLLNIGEQEKASVSPDSGSKAPPFSMTLRNDEGARLKLPSGSTLNLAGSDCKVVSLGAVMLDVARRVDLMMGLQVGDTADSHTIYKLRIIVNI